jgi:excisionase family DNA binding protein
MAEFLTTKEVATLLRVKERTIYELVRQGDIPVSRVTGKLLFPRELVEAWVRRHAEYGDGMEGLLTPPLVLAGSHDPLLDWALRESGSGIASFYDGSLDGLSRVAAGEAVACGLHVYEPEREDWNIDHVRTALRGQPVVLIEWARRSQGLIVGPGNPKGIRSLADLDGKLFIPRQKQAGSYLLLDYLMRRDGRDAASLRMIEPPARSEADVALAVAEGKADAGIGVETVARQYRLDFVPLFQERYDLAIRRRDYFEAPVQTLLDFARSEAFAACAAEFAGYDISGLGGVRYNGP